MNRFINRFGNCIVSLAVIVATLSANTVCCHIVYQEVLPAEVKKLRKF